MMRFMLSEEEYYKFSNGYIIDTKYQKKRYIIQLINNLNDIDVNKKFSDEVRYVSVTLTEKEKEILEVTGEVFVLFHKPYRIFIKYMGEVIPKRKKKDEEE